MTSPDFRNFISTLIPDHRTWLDATPSPSGDDFFNHYVGDPLHPSGLLRRYEGWRTEHGYTRVRPWNGSEQLGIGPIPNVPSPGRMFPWLEWPAAGPAMDARLASGRTTAQLQADFGAGNTSSLGAAILLHWNAVRNFLTPWGGNDLQVEVTAPYSVRFWGFMKWAAILRNRLLGIPVFSIPIVYDADGVPLSDVEYLDVATRWHTVWHRTLSGVGTAACGQVTSQATGNPFAPSASPYGQFCGFIGTAEWESGEFLKFHRDLLDTYDNWRRRAGMPRVERWKPPELHFHPHTQIPETGALGGPGLELSEDPAVQFDQIKSVVRHFNTLEALARYADDDLHAAGHGAPESEDIEDVFTNNYSPRFYAWHRWIDYLWEVRQPRFDSFRAVASDGTDYPAILTVVRPTPNPDRIEPNNALTGETAEGRGSVWIKYNVRPENWGRPINIEITGRVYRNSSDMAPVGGLDATPVPINAVAQGAESGPIEIQFGGLDANGEGAFSRENLPGGAIGFKNGRIRITGRLVPVGNIPGTSAIGNANDQFDHEEHIDIILVKEARGPVVSTLLNKSAFSVDEIAVNAAGGAQSVFANAFFVVLQDPPEPPVAYGASSIFSDPARTAVAGIFTDTTLLPEVVDDAGNTVVNWFTVALTDVFKELPGLHDNASQRVLLRYLAIVDVGNVTALLPNDGDVHYARLRITARDRAGNTVQNVLSPRIKLFREANPYMIDVRDQNPHWLSIDTRVFSVRESELKFNHRVSDSGTPSQYTKDVIAEFNNGTQNFEAIPADQGQAQLELAPQVGGQNVYNFALARVRMKTQVEVPGVRVFFRLFTTALSNLEFDSTNYPTSPGASPIALLGRTSPDTEITSIPFFAESRVETRDSLGGVSMTTQTDPANVQSFAITPPSGETIRYFGAYLDINSDTPRYPAAPSGNGAFPTAECVSIRNILRGQHQCMVAEIFYPGDPTAPSATPGTSDNLAQRNLLIIETDNPGHEATHRVQHSFDIVLPGDRQRVRMRESFRLQSVAFAPMRSQWNEDNEHPEAVRAPAGPNALMAMPLASMVPTHLLALPQVPISAQPVPVTWKDPGFDELVIFWNDLPQDARVEVYLPSMDVEYVMLLRKLRRAPQTVRAIDEHTLSLQVGGVTYLPIPNLGNDRAAGLLTVTLPDTISTGQVFTLDVLQMRALMGTIVGGFRLVIPVSKARSIYAREGRLLTVFEERLSVTRPDNRWYPILVKQVEYLRLRARGLTEEAAEECAQAPDKGKGVRVRVVLEKIKILDVHGPLVHGSGQVSLIARVTSTNAGGIGGSIHLPSAGAYPVLADGQVIDINKEIFRGTVVDDLTVEIFSAETDHGKRICYYRRSFTGKAEKWLGSYKPGDQKRDPENVGDWQLWYRIEAV